MGGVGLPPGQPIGQYILKVHGRCDLACDHCYVYEHADQSWRARPRIMSPRIVAAAAARIAEHARSRALNRVTVILHGGEPLLLGEAGLRSVLGEVRRTIDPHTYVDLRMQTNGVLLSEALCDVLAEYDVRVGVSLDGDRSSNDRHRRFANGASSHAKVLAGLALLRRPAYRRQYAGLLCTVDIRNDPVLVYEALAAELPPRIDFLLPHATWDNPPPRPDTVATPYARWLLAVHNRWIRSGRPMSVRLFESLLSTAAGGPSGNEWVGLDPADLVVIETDGAWEQVDSLKTTYDGATATGLSVLTHSVDDVAARPEIARRMTGIDDLAQECQVCPVVRQCGGGLFAHRYQKTSGFMNPSVYCADLMELIVSINERRAALVSDSAPPTEPSLPAELLTTIGSGRADRAIVEYLVSTQRTIVRSMVAHVAHTGSPLARASLAALGRIERAAPLAAQAVLGHPYVRVWAAEAIRRSDLGDIELSGYVGNIAAAAAVRAGTPVEVTIPVANGTIHLPSVGTLMAPMGIAGPADLLVRASVLTVRAGDDEYAVDVSSGDGPAWQASRWVEAGGDLAVLLEDLDPYRDVHDWKADGRLTDEQALDWTRSIADAWRVIHSDAPEQVAAMTAGFRAVTPLASNPATPLRSSTARHAFGSVGAAIAGPQSLAVMLVHEFQHTIMGAVLDLCDLFDRAYQRRLSVGWRADPRPIEGALQGTFAHLAVANIWRVRAGRPGAGQKALDTFRQYRDWTLAAIDTIRASGALTLAGEIFVDGMATTVANWRQ